MLTGSLGWMGDQYYRSAHVWGIITIQLTMGHLNVCKEAMC